MPEEKVKDSIALFEEALKNKEKGTYVLRLYVTGMTPNSLKAIENIRTVCRDHLDGCFELEVIDIYKRPDLAREEQVVAAPTLIKKLPPPTSPLHRRSFGYREDPGRSRPGKKEDRRKKPGDRISKGSDECRMSSGLSF